MLKRNIAVVLCAAVLVSFALSFTGCKKQIADNNGATTTATQSATASAVATTVSPTPGVTEMPAIDLGGRTVKVYSQFGDHWGDTKRGPALDVLSSTTAEGVEMRNRVIKVQKDYNCKIKFEGTQGFDFWNKVVTSNLAGTPNADFGLIGFEFVVNNLSQGGAFMALDRFKDILKLDDPTLWNLNVNNSTLRYGDMQLAVSPRMPGIDAPNVGFVTFFNKSMLVREGLWKQYNLYEMQKNKTWNWQAFKEISRKVTKDKNGDGESDQYGINYSEFLLRALMHTNVTKSGNGGFVNVTSKGAAEIVVGDTQHRPAINFLAGMFKSGSLCSAPNTSGGSDQTSLTLFEGGKVAFDVDYGNRLKTIKDAKMVDTLGVVAIPLSPTGQKDYILPANGFPTYVISAGIKKPEEIAYMLRLLIPPEKKTAEEEQVASETYLSQYIGDEDEIINTFTMLSEPERVSPDRDGVFLGGIGIQFWIFYYNLSTVITGTITTEQLVQMSLPKLQTTCNDWWSGIQKGLTKMKKDVAAGKK